MKTFYDLEKEKQEEALRMVISNDMKVEGMVKSVIIGVIIILVYYFRYNTPLLYKGNFIYLVVCLVDIFGLFIRYVCMKAYDINPIFQAKLKAIAFADEYYTKAISVNTLIYFIFNLLVYILIINVIK
nr:MAG TPA: hypothetical protein [Caudoviricetes sp.]